jgi:hypothetical protein
MSEALREIVEHYQRDDPEDAGFYTEDWARERCARLDMSPEELLATLAVAVEQADLVEDQPWTKGLPEHYKDKLSGPMDVVSAGLASR